MSIARRLCTAGASLAVVELSGRLGLGGSSNVDDWAGSGTRPVERVVQHHDPSCSCCGEYGDARTTGSVISVRDL